MFDLRYQLADTGLYSLDDPVSSGELQAYERQLNDLLAWQQQMKREMALDSTVLLIERWEKIYAVSPLPTDTIRDRQIQLLNKRRAKGVLTPAKVVTFAADFGYEVKVVKRVRPFCYRVEVQNSTFDVTKLDELLTRAEPGHQTHEFGYTTPTETVLVSGSARTSDVEYLLCGTFYPEDDLEGRIFHEAVAVAESVRIHTVDYPLTNTFYPVPE